MKKWVPLESNPEVLNGFAQSLGLNTQMMTFHDVWGLDEELLAFIPQPVKALLFLYPITPRSEAARVAQNTTLEAANDPADPSVYFMKQVRRGKNVSCCSLRHMAGVPSDGWATSARSIDRSINRTGRTSNRWRRSSASAPSPA